MNKHTQLILNINSTPEDDVEELAELTQQLREDIEKLDIEKVDLIRSEDLPKGAKDYDIIVGGSLLMTLTTSADNTVFPTLINTLQSWLTRHEHRKITLIMGGCELEVTDISSERQKRLVEAWISHQKEKKGEYNCRRKGVLPSSQK